MVRNLKKKRNNESTWYQFFLLKILQLYLVQYSTETDSATITTDKEKEQLDAGKPHLKGQSPHICITSKLLHLHIQFLHTA